jgi:6,7-dimethyl-8-ribityllumazine synthase
MSTWRNYEGGPAAGGRRFAVVAARYNDFIVDRLVAGAMEALKQHGASDTDLSLVRVPGAFELPFAAQCVARSSGVHAIVALGCVIRGATPHFEYVSAACVQGLTQVALRADLPVALGVLTVETIEQALERAGDGPANKGFEAALTAIEMADLVSRLRPA